jgi:hypothetical protein
MITLQDCIDLCGLDEDEVAAISEHEHIPEIAATALHPRRRVLSLTAGALFKFRSRGTQKSNRRDHEADDPETAVGRITELVKTQIPKRFGLGGRSWGLQAQAEQQARQSVSVDQQPEWKHAQTWDRLQSRSSSARCASSRRTSIIRALDRVTPPNPEPLGYRIWILESIEWRRKRLRWQRRGARVFLENRRVVEDGAASPTVAQYCELPYDDATSRPRQAGVPQEPIRTSAPARAGEGIAASIQSCSGPLRGRAEKRSRRLGVDQYPQFLPWTRLPS